MTDPIQRAANNYLAVVKAALLDEHYLDNEVRIEYLATLSPGTPPDLDGLRDPPRNLPVRFQRLAQARHVGRSTDEKRNLAYFPFTDMGRPQLERLHELASAVIAEDVPGDLAEVGTGRGGGAIFLRAFLEAHDILDRRVWVIDRFSASVPADAGEGRSSDLVSALARYRADLNQVRDGFARFGLLDDRVRFAEGVPEEALFDAPIERLALLRLGGGLGPSLAPVLHRLHPLVSEDGAVVIEGTASAEVERAVHDARELLGVTTPLERIDWNSLTWRVAPRATPSSPAVARDRDRTATSAAPHRVAPVSPAPDERVALSVVVVFFNMRREAARTLTSLTRAYQRGIDELDYEVIVLDNGSTPDQQLTEDYVGSFGPMFRYVDMGADGAPSPTLALNHGLQLARGDAVALMIDGAHVLTPGVLRLGMTAMSAYEPAIVATQQWYLGPGQQGDALHAGYDQVAEDALFDRIKWPEDGYRLFEIGHFIGERDWFDGIVESNCLFVPRAVLEQFGGYDDSFAMPGGGYANLELFERLGYAPGVHVASILGEGTFHQTHGGTTTNVADADRRRDLVYSYGEHFRSLRGRGLVGITKPVHYVGAMPTKAARRTRSRREITLNFDPNRDPARGDGAPRSPIPIADELKLATIEALWDHQAWKETTWLGHSVARLPTDLHTYQELLVRVRPGWVVVASDDDGLGGRALFAASICEQIGHGRVVAVGRPELASRPEHARVQHIVGPPEDAAVVEQVTALVADGAATEPDALVFLGLGAVLRVVGAFEHYAPLVPIGGYVVVENTVVNGRPVASAFGPGPYEAVVNILGRHREFVADPTCERYTLTFNRGGFLKRVSR
jgi:cephalosporin hydroxylase